MSNGWVGDDVGGVAYVDDMCVGMNEIRYDVDNNRPVNEFIGWYDYTLRLSALELPRTINYASYCKGAPLPYTEGEIKEIERLRERVREAEKSLKETMNKLNQDIDDGRN